MTEAAAPNLRSARDDDGDAIAHLIAACFAEYPGCVFDRAAEFPELDAIATHFAGQMGAMWVAEWGGGLVGCLAVRPTPSGSAELLKVYVAADQRGTGLARRLLAEAERYAAEGGIERMELWSDTRFTRAHRFYVKHGFVDTGERRFLGDVSSSWEARFVRSGAVSAAAG